MPLLCLSRIIAIGLLVFAAGCSSFDQRWNEEMAKPMPAGAIEGVWEGHWSTSSNGHSGELRCVLEKIAPNQYKAYFDATFLVVFHFDHPLILKAQPGMDGRLDFASDEYLGDSQGGNFHFEGHITPDRFAATYRSREESGTFAMNRAKGPPL